MRAFVRAFVRVRECAMRMGDARTQASTHAGEHSRQAEMVDALMQERQELSEQLSAMAGDMPML